LPFSKPKRGFMFRNACCLVGLVAVAAAQQPDARNAVITGTLTGDDGSVIVDGYVSLRFLRGKNSIR
jgi:hypothetical protein